jgi:hypothetical protein
MPGGAPQHMKTAIFRGESYVAKSIAVLNVGLSTSPLVFSVRAMDSGQASLELHAAELRCGDREAGVPP